MATEERIQQRSDPFILVNLHTHFMYIIRSLMFYYILLLFYMLHRVFCLEAPVCLFGLMILSHIGLLLYATIITGVVVETFPFV